MSVVARLAELGASVTLVEGELRVAGLDTLPFAVAEQVLAMVREHKEELLRELSETATPGSGREATGLEWLPARPAFDHPDHAGWWAAYDLADLAQSQQLRVVKAGGRIVVVYPPALPPELVDYAEGLLDEARAYLAAHLDKLPVLEPAQALEYLKDIMREHKSLGFVRGGDGSRWPVFPANWTKGQKATVRALWIVAGQVLDRDAFKDVEV